MQLFLFLFPLQRIKRPALQNKQVVVVRMAFRAPKVLGTFEKRAPAHGCVDNGLGTVQGLRLSTLQSDPSLGSSSNASPHIETRRLDNIIVREE